MKKDISKMFKCDCNGHAIELLVGSDDILSVLIYDLYDNKGNKLRNPFNTADVVLLGKELIKFQKFVAALKPNTKYGR